MSTAALQEILCCLGEPVAGNPNQFMFERAFAAAGLDWRYLTLEVSPVQLADAVRGLNAMGFKGAHFVGPHQTSVIPLLEGLTPVAEISGVVNCAYREGTRLIGDNTVGRGLIASLGESTSVEGKRVLILGADDLARTIAVELGLRKVSSILVVNRDVERGSSLVELLKGKTHVVAEWQPWQLDFVIPADIDMFIHATNESPARLPIDVHSLRAGLIVADVVLNPPRTKLLREAQEHGCLTVDGLTMLVHQAAVAFEMWSGLKPDIALLRDALEEFLGV